MKRSSFDLLSLCSSPRKREDGKSKAIYQFSSVYVIVFFFSSRNMLVSSVSNMVKVDYSDLTKTKDTPLKETCLFLPCVPVWIPTYIYVYVRISIGCQEVGVGF